MFKSTNSGFHFKAYSSDGLYKKSRIFAFDKSCSVLRRLFLCVVSMLVHLLTVTCQCCHCAVIPTAPGVDRVMKIPTSKEGVNLLLKIEIK